MKKILPALLLAAMLLSACAPDTTESSSTTGPEDTQSDVTTTALLPGTAAPPTHDVPTVVGGVRGEPKNYDVKEGDVIALRVSLNLPVAVIADNDDIQKKITERLDAIKEDISEYISEVEELYIKNVKDGNIPLFTPRISVSYILNEFTGKAMSLTLSIAETNAYGVTSYTNRHYNYDLDIASPITYSALFVSTSEVTRLICDKAKAQKGLFSNYESLISSLAESRWYIGDKKVVFCFDPYDIAPASYGFIEFTFTAEELSPYFSEYGRDLLGIVG